MLFSKIRQTYNSFNVFVTRIAKTWVIRHATCRVTRVCKTWMIINMLFGYRLCASCSNYESLNQNTHSRKIMYVSENTAIYQLIDPYRLKSIKTTCVCAQLDVICTCTFFLNTRGMHINMHNCVDLYRLTFQEANLSGSTWLCINCMNYLCTGLHTVCKTALNMKSCVYLCIAFLHAYRIALSLYSLLSKNDLSKYRSDVCLQAKWPCSVLHVPVHVCMDHDQMTRAMIVIAAITCKLRSSKFYTIINILLNSCIIQNSADPHRVIQFLFTVCVTAQSCISYSKASLHAIYGSTFCTNNFYVSRIAKAQIVRIFIGRRKGSATLVNHQADVYMCHAASKTCGSCRSIDILLLFERYCFKCLYNDT